MAGDNAELLSDDGASRSSSSSEDEEEPETKTKTRKKRLSVVETVAMNDFVDDDFLSGI